MFHLGILPLEIINYIYITHFSDVYNQKYSIY